MLHEAVIEAVIEAPPKGTDPRVLLAPGRGVGGWRLLLMVAAGCAAALPFGSRGLAIWADRLPPGSAAVQAAARRWDRAMDAAGLTAPYDAIHRWIRGVAATRDD